MVRDLFIVAIDEPQLNRLRLQYMPMQVQWQRSAKFDAIAIIGRNEDLHHYSGGQTQVSMSIDFYANDPDATNAKASINFLESLQYSAQDRAPSRVQLIMGRMFEGTLWLLQSMSVTYSVFEPNKQWLPRYAVAQCTFIRDTERDLFSNDIRTF